jgi:predicted ATP-grasp superfamily ATP-dependent carboligase
VPDPGNLLIFGASTRAAAFSALRAGLRPWCADLFADADLRARVPVVKAPGRYPEGFLDLVGAEVPGPWMYTGGLENRPYLVGRMAARRPLWGCGPAALRAVRPPFHLAALLRRNGLPGPAVRRVDEPLHREPARSWLVKPLAGAGGAGVRFLHDPETGRYGRPDRRCYLQEYLAGEPRAALFVGDGRSARLLGVTRQLVGREWLHASGFRYCGSIGPLPLSADEAGRIARLGDVLAGCGLHGLFGVDGVWRDGALWPVEVNPRYTASVEVVEHATSLRALAWHASAFDPGLPPPDEAGPPRGYVGKAVLFARAALRFPADGPWSATLASPPAPDELPPFADIPPAGEVIDAGRPVLTLFARAESADACEDALRRAAADLDRRLFP